MAAIGITEVGHRCTVGARCTRAGSLLTRGDSAQALPGDREAVRGAWCWQAGGAFTRHVQWEKFAPISYERYDESSVNDGLIFVSGHSFLPVSQ